MASPLIVLATDFGLADAYVGMMRGVIAGINPDASVIDLTHGIGPQNIQHGAAVLADASPYFPTGSIFVAVVDPGVGTDRPAILLETPNARYLAPDNGLLTLICRRYTPNFGDADATTATPVPNACRAWRLTNPNYWQHPVSATFHGRDIFAPTAAHLSLNIRPDNLGQPTPNITARPMPIPRPIGGTLRGQVIYADTFGNLITNITTDILTAMGDGPLTVTIAGHEITGLSRTFHDPPGHGLRALPGSHNRLEIVIVDGSAAATLGIGAGAEVVVAAAG